MNSKLMAVFKLTYTLMCFYIGSFCFNNFRITGDKDFLYENSSFNFFFQY